MRRFLVLQAFSINNGSNITRMLEPVIDFDEKCEAEDWINEQEDPTLFEIDDQFPDEEFEHDFGYYDLQDSDCDTNAGFDDVIDDVVDDDADDLI